MIMTVGNTKGGVGKTTLAIQIAATAAFDGQRVCLVDADRQGTSRMAMQIRSEGRGLFGGMAVLSHTDGATLRDHISEIRHTYDLIVVDAGGRDSASLRAALALSDRLLIPFQPRSFDFWALDDIAGLIEEAKKINPRLRSFSVLSLADPGDSADNQASAAAAEDMQGIAYLPTPIRRRKAYSVAASAGLSVLELRPQDKKASAELRAFMKALDV